MAYRVMLPESSYKELSGCGRQQAGARAYWHEDARVDLVVSQEGMSTAQLIGFGKAKARAACHFWHGILNGMVPRCQRLPHGPWHCKKPHLKGNAAHLSYG